MSTATIPNLNLPVKLVDGYEVPILDKPYTRIVEAIEQGGELRMDVVHGCGAVHCIAGWVIALCGEQGYALQSVIVDDMDIEEEDGGLHPSVGLGAGRRILRASSPLPIPGLYPDDYDGELDSGLSDSEYDRETNAAALVELRRLSAMEVGA